MQLVLVPTRARPDRAAGRHQRDRSSRGRAMPPYPVVTQVQFLWRASNNDEPVVGQGLNTEFKSWLRTATRRLHTDPFQPVDRRIRTERKDTTPVQRPDWVAALQLSPPRHLCP